MPITRPVTCGYGSGTPPQKLGDWKKGSDKSQMEKCESDGKVGVRFYVACILLVGLHKCSRLDKNGGTSNPNTGNSTMIARKNCVWLVGLVGWSDRWIVGGWIYSKPVGWLVCLQVAGQVWGVSHL